MEAKIEFKLGTIEFSGEGDKDWVAKQLDKILENAPKLLSIVREAKEFSPMSPDPGISKKPLAAFLKEKSADKSQTKKFLATAVWLEAKGKSKLSTAEVTRALRDYKQGKLSNATTFLSDNISKGFCEKDGKEFYVTQLGKDSI